MYGTVNQPGYYYLPPGSIVRDAVEAAHGFGMMMGWRYSGMERPTANGSFEVIRFRNRDTGEQLPLRNGDSLYFGHEVF
jgi:hypothetical protein